jgi:hypothetical protein
MRNHICKAGSTLAALVLAFALAIVAPSTALAASPTPTVANAAATTAPPGWNALKAKLNSNPQLHKTVAVLGDTRTTTYRSPDGFNLVLREPTSAHATTGVQPQLSIGGCDWFQVCLYLSHSEAVFAVNTGGVYLAAIICTATLGVMCFGAGSLLYYVNDALSKGSCSNGVRIELYPFLGAPWETACYG